MPEEQGTKFFVFRAGDGYAIEEMNQTEAASAWDKGYRWIDMPQQTEGDAVALIAEYQAGRA